MNEYSYEELIALSEVLKRFQPSSVVQRYAYGWSIWEAADIIKDLAEKYYKNNS